MLDWKVSELSSSSDDDFEAGGDFATFPKVKAGDNVNVCV